MTSEPVYSTFQRLGKSSDDAGMASEYMGSAEYEFGSAHAALYAMCVDIGAPKETVETNIKITQKDMSFGYQSLMRGPRNRQTQKDWKREVKELSELTDMTDGQNLLFRHIPEIAHEQNFKQFMQVTAMSDFNNKGGMFRNETRAWLCLNPVMGILYHPSQERAVDKYVDFLSQKYADERPDPAERSEVALKKLREQRGFVSFDGRRLMEIKNDSASLSM